MFASRKYLIVSHLNFLIYYKFSMFFVLYLLCFMLLHLLFILYRQTFYLTISPGKIKNSILVLQFSHRNSVIGSRP